MTGAEDATKHGVPVNPVLRRGLSWDDDDVGSARREGEDDGGNGSDGGDGNGVLSGSPTISV